MVLAPCGRAGLRVHELPGFLPLHLFMFRERSPDADRRRGMAVRNLSTQDRERAWVCRSWQLLNSYCGALSVTHENEWFAGMEDRALSSSA